MRHLARAGAAVLLAAAACTEPATRMAHPAPAPALEARLALSDSDAAPGSTVRVTIQLAGATAPTVASFTAQLRYDTAAARFLDEVPLRDGATRVSNPAAGLVRTAGVSTTGFTGGTLAQFDYQVLRRGGLASLALSLDEMHTTSSADVRASVILPAGATGGRLP